MSEMVERQFKALEQAQEALATATHWFAQREDGKPTTNKEEAIFARLAYVLDVIDASLSPRSEGDEG